MSFEVKTAIPYTRVNRCDYISPSLFYHLRMQLFAFLWAQHKFLKYFLNIFLCNPMVKLGIVMKEKTFILFKRNFDEIVLFQSITLNFNTSRIFFNRSTKTQPTSLAQFCSERG